MSTWEQLLPKSSTLAAPPPLRHTHTHKKVYKTLQPAYLCCLLHSAAGLAPPSLQGSAQTPPGTQQQQQQTSCAAQHSTAQHKSKHKAQMLVTAGMGGGGCGGSRCATTVPQPHSTHTPSNPNTAVQEHHPDNNVPHPLNRLRDAYPVVRCHGVLLSKPSMTPPLKLWCCSPPLVR